MNKCLWNVRLHCMQSKLEQLVSQVIDETSLNTKQKKIVLKRLADLHNHIEGLKL